MNAYGQQCDAITRSGKRCTRENDWYFHCQLIFDGEHYRFKPVRLCSVHDSEAQRLREQGKRLRLHHSGWFGAFNEHKYGNLVLNRPRVNWKRFKLTVPKFWAQKEEA